jgi:hypothetical protein
VTRIFHAGFLAMALAGSVSGLAVTEAERQGGPLLGVNTHFGQVARFALHQAARPLLLELGVRSIRDEAPWHRVEKVKGKLEFDPRLLETYQDLAKAGIRPLIILGYGNDLYLAPGRAALLSGEEKNKQKPADPEARKAFAEYCGFVAKALKGCRPIFQIWNEWHHPLEKDPKWFEDQDGCLADARLYADLIIPSAQAIRSADADATILVGCLSIGAVARNWDELLLQQLTGRVPVDDRGRLTLVDGISLHPYCHHEPDPDHRGPRTAVAWVGRFAKKLKQEASLKHLGIYVTEIGWSGRKPGKPAGKSEFPEGPGEGAVRPHPEAAFDVEEGTRGKWVVEIYRELARIPEVRGIWWYCLLDDGKPSSGFEYHYGLVDAKGAVRSEAFRSLKGLIKP